VISHTDRIRAVLRGEPSDRPPVALWRHFPVDDQLPDALAQAHLDFQDRYDFDLLKVTPASSYSVKDWGVDDVWEGSSEGTRTYTKRVIHVPADWERLRPLDPSAPHLTQQLECLRAIRQGLGTTTPLLQTIFNPLAQAKHLAGEHALLEHLRTHPESVRLGLQSITESTRLFIGAAVSAGIDGIFYAIQHAQAGLLSREEFQRFSSEAGHALLESAGDLWCNLLHIHGERIHLEAVKDYPAQILNWHDRVAGPSISEMERIWRHAMCAGLSQRTLVFGSGEDVLREAQEALGSAAPRRLILGAGCVVPVIAPHGNLRTARIAPEEHFRSGG